MRFLGKRDSENKNRVGKNVEYLSPAREEIKKTKESLNRIDRILLEAQEAEAIVRRRKGRNVRTTI